MHRRFKRRVLGDPTAQFADFKDDWLSRIYIMLRRHMNWDAGANTLAGEILEMNGGFRESGYQFLQTEDPLESHFLASDTIGQIEFIETVFHVKPLWSMDSYESDANALVNKLNDLFVEVGMIWRLTHCIPKEQPEVESGFKAFWKSQADVEKWRVLAKLKTGLVKLDEAFHLPIIHQITDTFTHSQITEPAINFLSDPRFSVALTELTNALIAFRQGDYRQVLTEAGSAFESVLKVICDSKGWTFDPNKSTASALIEICKKEHLFPEAYASVFTALATIRNRYSSAHGGGKVARSPSREEAEHFLHLQCTHVLYLSKLI